MQVTQRHCSPASQTAARHIVCLHIAYRSCVDSSSSKTGTELRRFVTLCIVGCCTRYLDRRALQRAISPKRCIALQQGSSNA